MAITKLELLKSLHVILLACKNECVKDADEWQIYDDMSKRIINLLAKEQRRKGYMAVYNIEDVNDSYIIFTGTKEQCDIYVDILLKENPEMKGNIIIADI